MKQKYNQIVTTSLLSITLALTPLASFAATVTATKARSITFPVIGLTSFSNDWHAPRDGHLHQGNDILGEKRQPLVAAVDGTVAWVSTPQRGDGLGFSIEDSDGYQYWYLHVNNDTPGTDDGSSRGVFAYAPDLYGGNPVVKGQLLGWLGDSGNAESTTPHLHFEIHTPSGKATNPFSSLTAANHITRPVTPPALANELLPFGQFGGGASIATGNFDPNVTGTQIVVAAGPGGGPLVQTMSQSGTMLSQFFAFDKSRRGGLDVASGDIDHDGTDEIIVGSGPGQVNEVRIFTQQGELLRSFSPYDTTFRNGIHVAAADLDGDGLAEIVTVPRIGASDIRVFDATGHKISQFMAYGPKFRTGLDIAAAPATEFTPAVIMTAVGAGGGPQVMIFDRNGVRRSQFFAAAKSDRHGLRIAVADIDTSLPGPEIITVPLTQGKPQANIFDFSGNKITDLGFFEPWWEGGYDIGSGSSLIVAVTGTPGDARRRTSIRTLFGNFKAVPAPRWWEFKLPAGD